MENTDGHHKDSIAKECFLADFSYTEILAFLSLYHGIELLLRQFHRNLRHLGMLFCRKISDYINTVIIAIKTEPDTSSSSYGHRMIHQNLRQMGVTTN